jgi:uncharacterized membrane protein
MQKIKQDNRLGHIDIFRGIALLIMVSIQIFDYLSVSNIYRTPPYYVQAINSVTWVPPSLLFTFVSGMSVFLLMQKRKQSNFSNKQIFLEVIKRYGKYLLLALPFTLLMWNLSIYLSWEEAVQGISMAAIFTTAFLLLFKNNPFVMLITIFASALLRQLLINSALFSYHSSAVVDFLLNMLFRGWFSILNLLPIMLGGILFFALLKKKSYGKMLTFSISFLLFNAVLYLIGYPINYYEKSFAVTFFAIGESALICSLAFMLYNKSKKWFIWDFLKTFGFTAFFTYMLHYLLILKMLDILKLKDLLPDTYAWIITIPLVLLVYVISKRYSKIREKLPSLWRL